MGKQGAVLKEKQLQSPSHKTFLTLEIATIPSLAGCLPLSPPHTPHVLPTTCRLLTHSSGGVFLEKHIQITSINAH